MPIYEYEEIRPGGKAGKRFQVLQKLSDKPLKKHPKTGRPVRRIFSGFNSPKDGFDKTRKMFERKDKQAAEKQTADQLKALQRRRKKLKSR